MSDTPRTDAATFHRGGLLVVEQEIARQLERELAAAKVEIDLLGSAADKFRAMWRNEVQDLIREKDQLHAEVERLREVTGQALEAMEKATRYMSNSDYIKLNQTIDALRAALKETK